MAVDFVTVDRETPDMFPATVREYLPEDHLTRFLVEIVDRLDLSQLLAAYAGTGSGGPTTRRCWLRCCSRAMPPACSPAAGSHRRPAIRSRFATSAPTPIPTTAPSPISAKRFLDELAGLFTEVLLIAQAMGLLKLGTVGLDGTKIKANASTHKALTFEHAERLEEQLKVEVDELLRLAE